MNSLKNHSQNQSKMDTSTLTSVQQRVHHAEHDAKRKTGACLLIGASKTQSDKTIRAFHSAGLKHFGENYLNEALDKIALLQDLAITWHYIGGIQSNKTKAIAENFDWVHTVDRLKIGQRLSHHLEEYNHNNKKEKNLNILLQVNLDGEQSKNGITPSDTENLAKKILELPHLKLRGLMSIPKPRDTYQEQLDCQLRLAVLQTQLNQNLDIKLDTLSAGMSGDLEAAIAAGSTMIRIGTDLFGKRQ